MAALLMDRSRRADRYLEARVWTFVVGAVLALGGMFLEKRWLVGVAIVVLVGGFGLRFLSPGREDPTEEGEDEPEVG